MPNPGTADAEVAFVVLGHDTTAELRSDRVRLSLADLSEIALDRHVERLDSSLLPPEGQEAGWIDPRLAPTTAIDFVFDGAREGLVPEWGERAAAIVSSFHGAPTEWRTGLPTFHDVVHHEAWPGIDLAWSGEAPSCTAATSEATTSSSGWAWPPTPRATPGVTGHTHSSEATFPAVGGPTPRSAERAAIGVTRSPPRWPSARRARS